MRQLVAKKARTTPSTRTGSRKRRRGEPPANAADIDDNDGMPMSDQLPFPDSDSEVQDDSPSNTPLDQEDRLDLALLASPGKDTGLPHHKPYLSWRS